MLICPLPTYLLQGEGARYATASKKQYKQISKYNLYLHNKLETFEDALWKLQNFNTQNWKPCTLDLSPCGKRNAEKSRLGHLWIVFYKSYPTLFALSHPFKPLVDYRLLCSQYNTGKTLEPACQRGLLLALKISIFGQLCLFPTGRIWSCAAMKSQIYI